MRIHRNCSNASDYEIQANSIINTFVEKGYNKKNENVKHMNRELITEVPKKNKKKRMDMAFFTGYNIQHKASPQTIIKRIGPF